MRRTRSIDPSLPPFHLFAEGDDGGGGGEGGGTMDWSSMVGSLPAELRDSVPDLGTSKDFPSFVGQYRDHRKMIGKDRLSLLTKDSQPEEIKEFFGKLGRPEKSTDYDLRGFAPKEGLPWDEAATPLLLEMLHRAGNNEDQANMIMRDYHDFQVGRYEQSVVALDESVETDGKALRREWGNDYNANIDLAQRAWKHIAGADLADIEDTRMQDGRKAGDHPVLIRILAEAGKLMHEHGRLGEGGAALSGHNGTPAAIRAKITELQASEKMKNPGHPQYPEAVKQFNTLIESLGNEPLDAGGAEDF